VIEMLKACDLRDFSVHEREPGGTLYRFAYLDCTGEDFDLNLEMRAADPDAQRWRRETAPCQRSNSATGR
jgi:L-rhamnose mutarotase